ncbi:MAG: DUF4184 family protein [Leptolyngbyaceae cyanobacterium MO_188.B28]|nr:DUF4184 family protein [Leptolyngbyaceae cyanobacterium MO_188.B28]
MPFTPTHILAVVPVRYIWPRSVPFSALVIGSTVPDWPLFISVGPSYHIMHSFKGILTASIPLGFTLYLVFQILLKRPLFELLPYPFRQRLQVFLKPPKLFHPQNLAGAIIAIAIGAMTHIIWDAFTHKNQWGVQVFPLLNETFQRVAGSDIHGYELLQYGSTVIGTPILLLCLRAWFRSSHPQSIPPSVLPKKIRTLWISSIVFIPLVFSIFTATQFLAFPITVDLIKLVIFKSITQAGFVLFCILTAYSFCFYPLIKGRVS